MTSKHKHYDLVYRAFYNTSFSPDKRAADYCAGFDADIEKLKSLGVPNDKISKYEGLWVQWMQSKSRCLSSMITGPANFPVARAEKARNAEHNRNEECIAYFNKIVDYAEKEKYYAENPTARPIQSDDENAIEKLQAKLDICKANQEKMIQANKLIRKNDHEGLRALFGDDYAEKVLKHDYLSRVGFAQFELSNNRAEIKRLEGRINEIQKRKATTPKDLMINGVRFLENHEAMRIQIFFEGKPDAAMITLLKSCAFKWAPSVKAWQRQLTNNAIDAVNRRIIPAVKGV